MKMAPEPDARTVDVAGTAQATISITRLVSSPRRARDATICVHHAHSRQKKLVNGRRTFDSKESSDGTGFSTAPGVAHRHRSHRPVRSLS
jgi:hypothetical protein